MNLHRLKPAVLEIDNIELGMKDDAEICVREGNAKRNVLSLSETDPAHIFGKSVEVKAKGPDILSSPHSISQQKNFAKSNIYIRVDEQYAL